MNLSETAFILPVEKNVFKIRYFTPLSEVPLCGHATLAGAHILFEHELVKQGDTIQFKAQGADLEVNMDSSWIIMNFPEYPLKRIDIPDKFKEIVGFQPLEVYSSLYGWKVAVGKSADIIAADPIFNKM